VTLGSSGVVFAHVDRPARDPRLHGFCHAVPGTWHLMAVTQAAGLSLRWVRDQLAPHASYQELTAEAADAPAGSDGLIYTPYLMGERTPHLDPHARGTFFGLTFAHRRAHLVRAVMEGVAFSMRDCIDLVDELGGRAGEVCVAGGGAASALWRQILADVLEREVTTLRVDGGPAYGAALLAGVGAGAWGTVDEACAACLGEEQVGDRRRPDPVNLPVYRERLRVYRELHQRLQPLYRLAQASG